jgi:hypothetical protein
VVISLKGTDVLEVIIRERMTILFLVCSLSVFICNFVIFSIFKRKYNSGLNIFFYGAGFTACWVMFVYYQVHNYSLFEGNVEMFFWILYILPVTTLYYSYAGILQNNEKSTNKITLCLSIITLIFFAVLIILEIIECQSLHLGVFLIPYGLYLSFCLFYKKGKLPLQLFAWSPFLPSVAASVNFMIMLLKLPF